VNPKWVPQFKDARLLFESVQEYASEKGTKLIALVPNEKGAILAREAGVKTINLVISASSIHNVKNVNSSIDESLEQLKKITDGFEDMDVRLAVACVFGCPFGEEIPVDRILHICREAKNMGIDQIGLGDSAGLSTPKHTREVLRAIKKDFDIEDFGIHFHDTRGMGIANAFTSYEEGIRSFDASLGALGGCPFIPGAKGNIGTEDLVNMMDNMDVGSGYDLDSLIDLTLTLEEIIEKPVTSSMASCMRKIKI